MKTKKDKIGASKISETLSTLMQDENISEAELARRTKLPTTTINRLLSGETVDPRANTLIPISKYFGISIDQLIGETPFISKSAKNTQWISIPIIEWEDAPSWIFQSEKFIPYSHHNWIASEKKLSSKCFAVIAKPFMEPRFKANSILIIDPDKKLEDGKYVLLTSNGTNATVRKLKIDGINIYLEQFDSRLPLEKLEDKTTRILGTIIESRVSD